MIWVLHYLYAIAIPLVLVWFVPQILKTYKTKSAKDVSLMMWVIWNATTFTSFLYAFYVIQDIKMILMNLGQFIMCFTMLILIIMYSFIKKS